jgi:prophage regulatory protein
MSKIVDNHPAPTSRRSDPFDNIPVIRLNEPIPNRPEQAQPSQLLTIGQVMCITSLARATIYRKMRTGAFPAQIRLQPGRGRVAWRRSDVERWLREPASWDQASA